MRPGNGADFEQGLGRGQEAARGRRGLSPLRNGLRAITVITIFCGMALSPLPLSAKKKAPPSRTISGQILDKTGNAIPDATVELTDVTAGKKVAMFSQEDGSYMFDGLQLNHDYQIQASYKGEASETRRVSSIEPRNRVVINLTIPPDNP